MAHAGRPPGPSRGALEVEEDERVPLVIEIERGGREHGGSGMDGERGGTRERPTRERESAPSACFHVKMGKETEARGNMDIFIGRSHLLGLLLFSNGTWIMDGRVHGKRK